MTSNDIHDMIQTSKGEDVLVICDLLNMQLAKLEHRIQAIESAHKELESSHKRTANIASCLANGIQPD